MLFQNGSLLVRELMEKDSFLLTEWLSNPKVLEFYEGRDNPFDLDRVKREFFDSNGVKSQNIIVYENVEIGYVQFYMLDEKTKKEYGYDKEVVYGTDQFLGEVEYWNKGIGSLLVKSMTAFLFAYKKADRVVMDPQVRNHRAIKCYEKCGFKKVKILPKRELHEGEYQDCWLMERQKKV